MKLHLFHSKIFKSQFWVLLISACISFGLISLLVLQVGKQSLEHQQLIVAENYLHNTTATILDWIKGREDMLKIQALYLEAFDEAQIGSTKVDANIRRQLVKQDVFHDFVFLIGKDYTSMGQAGLFPMIVF